MTEAKGLFHTMRELDTTWPGSLAKFESTLRPRTNTSNSKVHFARAVAISCGHGFNFERDAAVKDDFLLGDIWSLSRCNARVLGHDSVNGIKAKNNQENTAAAGEFQCLVTANRGTVDILNAFLDSEL
jgi:hypothetical protein